MRLIIGIAGPLGAGKSTAANHIKKRLSPPYNVKTYSFAAPLKEFAKQLGWDGNKDAKGRLLLQLLGTEIGRNCLGKDFWVNKWSEQIYASDADIIIVDDLRFLNEVQAIREHSKATYSLLIKIVGRSSLTKWKRLVSKIPFFNKLFLHKSEIGLPNKYFDTVIKNDLYYDVFYYELDRVLEQIKSRFSL